MVICGAYSDILFFAYSNIRQLSRTEIWAFLPLNISTVSNKWVKVLHTYIHLSYHAANNFYDNINGMVRPFFDYVLRFRAPAPW